MVQPRRRNVRGSDEDGSAPRRSFLSAGQRQDKAAPCALGVPSSPECSGFASWRKTSWSRARWHGSYPERVGSGCTSQPNPESFRLELFRRSFNINRSLKFFLLFPCAQHHFDPPPVDQHRVFWAHPGCCRSLLGKLHLKYGKPHNWVLPAVEDGSLSGVQLLSGCIFFCFHPKLAVSTGFLQSCFTSRGSPGSWCLRTENAGCSSAGIPPKRWVFQGIAAQ